MVAKNLYLTIVAAIAAVVPSSLVSRRTTRPVHAMRAGLGKGYFCRQCEDKLKDGVEGECVGCVEANPKGAYVVRLR